MIEGKQLELKWISPSGTRKNPKAPILTSAKIEQIDLHTAQTAWKNESLSRRRFVTKLTTRQLPTGRRMQQFKFWKSALCPLCHTAEETTEHIFQCQDQRAVTARNEAINTLEQALSGLASATDIKQGLLMLVRSRLLGHPLQRQSILRDEVRRLIGQQLWIHPFALLHGRLHRGWATAQQNAYANYAPWRSGQTWATATVQALWQMAFTIWDHRNNVLHSDQANHPDIDPDEIDLAILEEWAMGPDSAWPTSSRSLFMGTSCELLLTKPIHHRIQWLYYVRLARRPHLLSDE